MLLCVLCAFVRVCALCVCVYVELLCGCVYDLMLKENRLKALKEGGGEEGGGSRFRFQWKWIPSQTARSRQETRGPPMPQTRLHPRTTSF